MSRARIIAVVAGFAAVAVLAVAAWTLRAGDEVVELWPAGAAIDRDGATEAVHVRMTAYIPNAETSTGIGVVICPGGGYRFHVLEAEGHAIGRWLRDNGVAGFVLEYRLPAGRAEVPLLDAERALSVLRERAADWHLDHERVGIMGFSAGGHLAGNAATLLDPANRPAFAVLVYPVVSMGEGSHAGSRKGLLGETPDQQTVNRFSIEQQVGSSTPPFFIAHAVDDALVPIDQSRELQDALRRAGVPVELLELPSGDHTLDSYEGPMWERMKTESLRWLLDRF